MILISAKALQTRKLRGCMAFVQNYMLQSNNNYLIDYIFIAP